ncbi:lipolysis-stimulated lipoprotein receptor [Gastrophryne carolinensis]
MLEGFSEGTLLVGGDFNISMQPELDSSSGVSAVSLSKRNKLKKVLADMQLVDSWRALHARDRDFTFFSSAKKSYSRIDYLYLSHHAMDWAPQAQIGQIVWSDHAPIFLSVCLPGLYPGCWNWRLNNNLLGDAVCMSGVRETIKEFLKNHAQDPTPLPYQWEALKCVVRGEFIKHGTRLKKQRAASIRDTIQLIQSLERDHKRNPTNSLLLDLLKAREKLQGLYSQAYLRFRERQKAIYYESADKCGRLLARALHPRSATTYVPSIRGSQGHMTMMPSQIVDAFRDYYQSLYNLRQDQITPMSADPPEDVVKYVYDTPLPPIPEEEAEALEEPFSVHEVAKAIRETPQGKSPGADGYTPKFYKQLAPELIPFLVRVFNSIGPKCGFPGQSLEAIITVLPKPGKDPSLCSSYRPISLINVDIKLYAKMISSRLQPLLPGVINLDQVNNGTRQGCPLSPLLYVITMEHLAVAIRQNPDIRGVVVGDREYKASLYADDLLLHLGAPLTSFPVALKEFETFGRVSNFKINYSKSEALNVSLSQQMFAGSISGMTVTVQNPFNVVILFQPITLRCNYETTALQPPIITWKYKSFCRNRITDAFSSTSSDTQINNQLQAANPGYNPYVDCQDNSRTVRMVATKQGSSVTLGDFYQGRKITITNKADLTIDQTAWGDSGVYYCSVVSSQDLSGNFEAYAELLVLGRTPEVSELLPDFQIDNMEDWLFVVLVILGAFFLFLMCGICWCQCCPHTCCCYVRCPCCPEKCCCPRALYEAGKAATSGVPSMYAPSVYAPSVYSHPSQVKVPPPGSVIQMNPMQPAYNGYGYGADFDAASSVGGHSSQAPLIRDNEPPNSVRSGYRIQANQVDDSMRVLYYMEKELANFDPTRPGPNSRFENATAMSEVSSLHEDDQRNNLRNGLGRLRNQGMTPIRDVEEESLLGSDYRHPPSSRQDPYDEHLRGGPGMERRGRAHSVDDLDDYGRRDRYYPDPPSESRSRGRRNSDDDSSRGYSRGKDGRSPDPRDDHYGGRRSRSRDDLRDLGRSRHEPEYDDRFLEDVLRRKQQRAGSRDGLDSVANSSRSEGRKNRYDDDDFPPPPPPYTETESVSSRGKKLKRGEALSRESLVV